MNRIPLWLHTTVAVALLAVAIVGVTNSVHLAAKIFYAVLIAAGAVLLTHAYHRRQA